MLSAENLIEERLFLKLGLPFPMGFYGFCSFLHRQGQPGRISDRSQGFQQYLYASLDKCLLAQKLTLFWYICEPSIRI